MLEYRETTRNINFSNRVMGEEITVPNLRKLLTGLGITRIPRGSSYTEIVFVGADGYCRYALKRESFQMQDFSIGIQGEVVLKDARRTLSQRLNGTDLCLVVTEKSTRTEISPDKLTL